MEYNVEGFRNRLENNLTLSTAFSNRSLRILISHVLRGANYRLITERNTKDKLFLTYLWLIEIYKVAHHDKQWKEKIVEELTLMKRKPLELKNLQTWLVGLPQKTAKNIDLTSDLLGYLEPLDNHYKTLFETLDRADDFDLAWLMLISGAATLTIRGSDKSKVGKQLEKVLVKSALTILGFTLNENFWINIERDKEVGRETDAEVETKRGRIQIEVGLIAAGNQEVIEDKIGRVGRNGIILFDKIGSRSKIQDTATARGVNLIQIRNGNPLQELYDILRPLVNIELTPPPPKDEVARIVAELPDSIFDISDPDTEFEENEEG